MKIGRLYLILVVLNFLPIIGLFIYLSSTIGIESMRGDQNLGFFIYGFFFFLSSIMNLSLFLFKEESIKNNKFGRFLSYYLSSLFFLILSTYILVNTILIKISYGLLTMDNFIGCIKDSLLFYIYFFVNFLPVFFYRSAKTAANNAIKTTTAKSK